MTWLLNYLQTVIVNTFITTYNSLMLKYRMKIYTLGWGLFTLLFYCSTDRNICYWKNLNSCQFSWFSWSITADNISHHFFFFTHKVYIVFSIHFAQWRRLSDCNCSDFPTILEVLRRKGHVWLLIWIHWNIRFRSDYLIGAQSVPVGWVIEKYYWFKHRYITNSIVSS